jgi:TolA-binding protein
MEGNSSRLEQVEDRISELEGEIESNNNKKNQKKS